MAESNRKITFSDGSSALILWSQFDSEDGLVTRTVDLRDNDAFPTVIRRGESINVRKDFSIDGSSGHIEVLLNWNVEGSPDRIELKLNSSIGGISRSSYGYISSVNNELRFYLVYYQSGFSDDTYGFSIATRSYTAVSNGNYNDGTALITGATYNGVTTADGQWGFYRFPAGTTLATLYEYGARQTSGSGGEAIDAFTDTTLVTTRRLTSGSNNLNSLSSVQGVLKSDFDRITEAIPDTPTPTPDPFGPGGTSEPGGGGGTFDDDSDEIPDSSLPTLSAANTGFTRIYNPTLSQVQAMANYLWTDDSVIETIWNHIKQFLEDPMDAFIAFNLIPCAVPNGGTSNFKVMYIDTGVAMTTAANQFVDVDCGTVQLDRYYGSALDYTPYTRVGCFLPYIGTVELDTDEVMGATLQVKYRIDIVSGACVAKIFVDGTCLYQYSGHCAINIPFTSADFSNYVNAIIQVAKAGLIAASGVPITSAGAGEAAEQLTGRTVTTTKTTQRNPATGRQIVTGTETTERDIYSTEASFKGLSPSNLANTVGAVMGSKPMIEHSGGFNGNSGYLGIRRPFLIIKRPRMCNPSGYGALNGYPCMIKETLGNLSGYTQVQQVQLTGLSATNPEQAEILQLLKQGVIL